MKEAHKDMPPLYRGQLWAVLLGVIGDFESEYTMIDKETVTATDRQVCCSLLSSSPYLDHLPFPLDIQESHPLTI